MTAGLSRRSFLQYGAGAALGSVLVRPAHRVADFELEEVTIAQLQEAMKSGARTSRSICTAYLKRITDLDPKLHAVIETNPEALAIAVESNSANTWSTGLR